MSEEQELEEQKARDEVLRAQRKADWRELLSLPAGRRVIDRLVYEFGGLLELSHSAVSAQTSFHEGQRAVGYTLRREIRRADQVGWALLESERTERERLEVVDPEPNRTDA